MAEVSRLGTHWHKCVPPFCEGHRSIRLSVGKEPSKLPDFFPVCQRRGCVRANESTKIPQFWAHSRAESGGPKPTANLVWRRGAVSHGANNFFFKRSTWLLGRRRGPPPLRPIEACRWTSGLRRTAGGCRWSRPSGPTTDTRPSTTRARCLLLVEICPAAGTCWGLLVLL